MFLYRSSKMNSKNELLNDKPFPENHQIIPKIEPIDIDFIKEEEFEFEEEEDEESFVVSELVEPIKIEEVSMKNELCENEKFENSSSTNVWNLIIFYDVSVNFITFVFFCILFDEIISPMRNKLKNVMFTLKDYLNT